MSQTHLSFDRLISCFGHLTPQLKLWLQQSAVQASPGDFEQLVRDTFKTLHQCMLAIATVPEGAARARWIHEQIDFVINASPAQVSCTKGCSACCHFPKQISKDEAELLAQRVAGGVSIDRNRLENHNLKPLASSPVITNSPCVFLNAEGECRVYSDRPMTCRKYFALTPAENCADPTAPVIPYSEMMAEVMTSTALSLPSTTFGKMEEMLSAALRELEASLTNSAQLISPIANDSNAKLDEAASHVNSKIRV